MALGYAQGSIAAVPLEDGSGTPCRVLIIDGANLKPTMIGATQYAADSTPFTQVLAVTAGAQFGVRCEFIPPGVLNAIIDAINAASIAGDGSFNVTLDDDIHSINASVIVDHAAGWVRYASQRTHPDTVKEVEFRFITI